MVGRANQRTYRSTSHWYSHFTRITTLSKFFLPSGAISDASTSRYRRRYWVVLSTVALVVSTFTLAYCQSLAEVVVDLFGGGKGSWDPQWAKDVRPCSFIFHKLLTSTLSKGQEHSNHISCYFFLRARLRPQCPSSVLAESSSRYNASRTAECGKRMA